MALLDLFDKKHSLCLYPSMGIVGAHGLKLAPGERLLACAIPNPLLFAPRWLMALAPGIAGLFLANLDFPGFPLAGGLAMFLLLLWAELDRWSARVWITDRRLAVRIAWLDRQMISLGYAQLAACFNRQNCLEHAVGAGSLWALSTSGASVLLIEGVHDSAELCVLIERVRSARKGLIF